jgi:hypothetical protein
MPTRAIAIAGREWKVFPSGRITSYDQDEFSLVFVAGAGDDREVRVTRYSPQGTRRSREQSLAELGDADLLRLFEHSQPGDTSPEAGYTR